MERVRRLIPVALAVAIVAAVHGQGGPPGGPSEGTAARDRAFDAEYARLKAGRMYDAAPGGRRTLDTVFGGTRLDNVLDVPASYDPSRRWPLRVQLHGGVGRAAPEEGGAEPRPLGGNRIAGRPELVLQPRAFGSTAWWQRSQVENVRDLIDRVRRTYNVDESQTYITGVSDGGTGVYYFAMRDPTRFSACLPLNGHPSVLANPEMGVEGDLFASNLVNCPLYVVNGGRDRLYPAAGVSPFIEMMKAAGVPVTFTIYPDAGHDTSWWPTERPRYEAYLATHPRDPHPARISWATERPGDFGRFRWLVLDQLGERPSDALIHDVNLVTIDGKGFRLYTRRRSWGRVDVTRSANTFTAQSRGVKQFTLLLSPDVVDFSRTVTVVINGRTVFDGLVPKDAGVLRKWADRDHDRTMLYGAALQIVVP